MANTRLHKAARELNLTAIKQAIEEGAEINAGEDERLNLPGVRGTTALHIVMAELVSNKSLLLFEKIEFIDYLLSQGADINAKTSDYRTPLSFSMPIIDPIYQSEERLVLPLIQHLLKNGAGPDVRNYDNQSYVPILHTANFPQIAKLLENECIKQKITLPMPSTSVMTKKNNLSRPRHKNDSGLKDNDQKTSHLIEQKTQGNPNVFL